MQSTIISKYGEQTVLNYVQSRMGQGIIGQEFSNFRTALTQKFNTSSQTSSNLDRILAEVSSVEAHKQ
jgi:hypothetical protein